VLRSAAGVVEEAVSVPADASLQHVLARLGELHGPSLGSMLFEPEGSLVSHLVVFRNRKLVPSTQDQAAQRLVDGDELMLFPAVSGG
jgi:molybdopterin converting factor small subunit